MPTLPRATGRAHLTVAVHAAVGQHAIHTWDVEVALTPSDGEAAPAELRLPAEAFVRLVYGRMDEAHTPPLESTGVDLGELRQLFPGL